MEEVNVILNSMTPISLEAMSEVRLMNRIDTKYLFTRDSLLKVLDEVAQHYYVQEIDGRRVASYRTIYCDTPDLVMYHIHHNKKLNRDKVRFRSYVDSGISFCEVKHKNHKGRTKKERVKIDSDDFLSLTSDVVRGFLTEAQPYPVDALRPSLETVFDRITLVNEEKTERLTMDCNLCFHNYYTDKEDDMGSLVVVELKQDGRRYSLFKEVLSRLRIKPFKMSKYCIGICLTNDAVKRNRFKPKLRVIERLKNNTSNNTKNHIE